MRYGVALLVIVGAAPFADLARAFVVTRPRIEQFLGQHTPPFIARVYRPSPADAGGTDPVPGRVELWYPR
jgi:hypothetical protein